MNFLMILKTIKNQSTISKSQKGTGMVEVLIAAGIMAIVLVTVINVYHALAALSLQNTEKIQSAFLLEEGVEAVRILRDRGWTANIASLSSEGVYYLNFQGGTWVATTSRQIIDGFDRKLVISPVNRDGSFNIVTSGGSVDTNSRKATITVEWNTRNGTTSTSIDTYVFNTFNN